MYTTSAWGGVNKCSGVRVGVKQTSERTAVISRCTQQRSRHAKRTAAIARFTQYVSRQTVGNSSCHHKMHTVLQLHEVSLRMNGKTPSLANFYSESPIGLLSDRIRCMQQKYGCVLREWNVVERCVSMSGYKIRNRQAREWLPSHSAAGKQKEWMPSQDVHSMCQGKQWDTAAMARCTSGLPIRGKTPRLQIWSRSDSPFGFAHALSHCLW